MKDQNGMKEFASFLSGNIEPPKSIERELFAKIRTLLNPSLPRTLGKIFLFHVVGSFVTLLFCPQFGISLRNSLGIMGYMMAIHPAVCFLGCGLLWMVGGQALTYAFLTMDEQRVLGRYRWGAVFTIFLLSVLLFGCLGSLRVDEWLLYWIVGASAVTFAFNWPVVQTLRRIQMRVHTTK